MALRIVVHRYLMLVHVLIGWVVHNFLHHTILIHRCIWQFIALFIRFAASFRHPIFIHHHILILISPLDHILTTSLKTRPLINTFRIRSSNSKLMKHWILFLEWLFRALFFNFHLFFNESIIIVHWFPIALDIIWTHAKQLSVILLVGSFLSEFHYISGELAVLVFVTLVSQ